MKRLAALCAVLAAGLLVPVVAAAHDHPGMQKTRVVRITLGEFYFAPNVITLKSGQMVTFVLVNKGKLGHEFMLGRGPFRHEDGMIHGYKYDFFRAMNLSFSGSKGAAFAIEDTGTEVALEPGASARLTFMVAADRTGTWQFGCFVPGHYQAGQKGTLTVVR